MYYTASCFLIRVFLCIPIFRQCRLYGESEYFVIGRRDLELGASIDLIGSITVFLAFEIFNKFRSQHSLFRKLRVLLVDAFGNLFGMDLP